MNRPIAVLMCAFGPLPVLDRIASLGNHMSLHAKLFFYVVHVQTLSIIDIRHVTLHDHVTTWRIAAT